MTLLSKDLFTKLPHLLLGGGMGAGAIIAYELAEREPKALIETFQHWGAQSLIGLVALVVVSQLGGRFIDLGESMLQVGRDNASSQQKLADAVQELANRDDREKEEQRRLLSFVGSQQEKILVAIDELKQQGNRSRGASA
ncbi:MAG: hypothetical protein ACJ71W_00695 [Terriglobales bacterium]